MDSSRSGAARTKATVVIVGLVVTVAGLGAFAIGGSSAVHVEDPTAWSPNPAKDTTPDNGTETNWTDETSDESTNSSSSNWAVDTSSDDSWTTVEDSTNNSTDDTENRYSEATTVGSASIVFEDQESDGTSVTVQSVTAPDGGFVVIHNESFWNGHPASSVIGVKYVESGTSTDVSVRLFETASDTNHARERLNEGRHQLTAVLYQDTNDNEQFEFYDSGTSGFGLDTPYVDEDGSAIGDNAFIDGPPVYDNATIDVSDDTSGPASTSGERETPSGTYTATAGPSEAGTTTPWSDEETSSDTYTKADSASVAEATPTPTGTSPGSPTPTASSPPSIEESTAESVSNVDEQAQESTEANAPGFDAGVAVVAFLGVGLLATRHW